MALSMTETADSLFQHIERLQRMAERTAQNEKIKQILQESGQWRPDGQFEMEIERELEMASQLGAELEDLFEQYAHLVGDSDSDDVIDERVQMSLASLAEVFNNTNQPRHVSHGSPSGKRGI